MFFLASVHRIYCDKLSRLNDLFTCSTKTFYIFGVGVYMSQLKLCRKIKFRIQLHLTLINTRKRFSEKTIVAFPNSAVFILDFYRYD